MSKGCEAAPDVYRAESRHALSEFAEALSIEVPPDSRYEAWSVDSSRIKLVAVPGDELAVWHR
jgi:hypothetical protein